MDLFWPLFDHCDWSHALTTPPSTTNNAKRHPREILNWQTRRASMISSTLPSHTLVSSRLVDLLIVPKSFELVGCEVKDRGSVATLHLWRYREPHHLPITWPLKKNELSARPGRCPRSPRSFIRLNLLGFYLCLLSRSVAVDFTSLAAPSQFLQFPTSRLSTTRIPWKLPTSEGISRLSHFSSQTLSSKHYRIR